MDLNRMVSAVADFYGNQPHPQLPQVKVSEYPAFERVASQLFEEQLMGHPPEPKHVEHAFETLKGAQMTPAEFDQVWLKARAVSKRLLDKDPTIHDLVALKAADPRHIHDYYMNHPYPGYEEVTAGQMARYWRAAEPIARRYGKNVNAQEVSRFAIAGYGHDDIHAHYQEEW